MEHKSKKLNALPAFGLVIVFILAGCNYPTQPPPNLLPTPSASTDSVPLIATGTPVPEPAAERVLSVCLTGEPASLFIYGDSSASARAIRQAIYDGPVELIGYSPRAVIVENIPSLADGGAKLEPVQVNPGDLIVDAAGELTTLAEGVSYLPSGCTDSACAAIYTGSDPVSIDQLAVQYVLLQGLNWSDGAPLTADDSLYSYEVARALFPKVRAELIKHTASYRALDDHTLEWRGVAGFLDPEYATNIFFPLPEHAWGDLAPVDLATAEISARKPLGWGPYVIDEWIAGDHITLSKNDVYFRSDEGLPLFDRLVFRFAADGEQALSALLAGECDLVDETPLDYYSQDEISQVQNTSRVTVYLDQNTAWEQLTFGIQPLDASQPVFFQVKEVRQAVASCINRSLIVESIFSGQSQVMHTYVPANHPLYNAEVPRYEYDPQAGAELLQAAGWVDLDNDPETPRQSQGVPGVPDGTPFQIEFLTLKNPERQSVAEIIKDSLAQCGIGLEIRTLEPEQLFAAGPEGPIFGRSFSLAQFGWPASLEPPCSLYTTAEIPGPYPEFAKGWGGANASGFSSINYDQACLRANNSLPDDGLHKDAHLSAQAVFAEEVPAVPLYSRSRVVLARPDFCGLQPDPLAESVLWNLEEFDYGEGCTSQ